MSCGVIGTSAARGTTRARTCSRSRESFLPAPSATRHALRHVWPVANPDARIVAFLGFCLDCSGGGGSDHIRDTEAVQRQKWNTTRSGTKLILESGRRRTQTLDDNSVRPRAVRELLQVDDAQQKLRSAQRAIRTTKDRPSTLLLEYCCNPTALHSTHWKRDVGPSQRLGLPHFDLVTKRSVDAVIAHGTKHLRAGGEVRLHSAIPCDPWCAWHMIFKDHQPRGSKNQITHSIW